MLQNQYQKLRELTESLEKNIEALHLPPEKQEPFQELIQKLKRELEKALDSGIKEFNDRQMQNYFQQLAERDRPKDTSADKPTGNSR